METLIQQEHALSRGYDFHPVVSDGIIYGVLDEQSVQEAIHCLTATFPANEPMTKYLGISQEVFHNFANMYVRKAAIEGLSIVATDIHTGKLVGCQISEDFEGESPTGLDHLHPAFDPIFALLDALDSHYKKTHLTCQNELLHAFLMGVFPTHKGQNIGYNLLKASHTLGRIKGFKSAIAEVTGPISQRIFKDKHHYQVLEVIKYNSFKYCGKSCFERMPYGATCQLVYKYLQFCHYKKNLIVTHKKRSLRLAA